MNAPETPAAPTQPKPVVDPGSPQAENRNHRYVGNVIPWYVRVLWLGFWIFAISYVLIYLVPDVRRELRAPAASQRQGEGPKNYRTGP
jgi:hypothetical protein